MARRFVTAHAFHCSCAVKIVYVAVRLSDAPGAVFPVRDAGNTGTGFLRPDYVRNSARVDKCQRIQQRELESADALRSSLYAPVDNALPRPS